MRPEDRLIVALDVPGRDSALALARCLGPVAGRFKVGLELFTAAGPGLVAEIAAADPATGGRVFLDLKFHDIPNTVAGAVRAAVRTGAWMMNVHASGGREMMHRAAAAAAEESARLGTPRPLVVAVTVLTSLDAVALTDEVGVGRDPLSHVLFLAERAREAGLDGVVCSPLEVGAVKRACGREFLAVTPGVRPVAAAAGDQRRHLTPAAAVAAGADYLVVGRPITAAPDSLAAARRLLGEMGGGDGDGRGGWRWRGEWT